MGQVRHFHLLKVRIYSSEVQDEPLLHDAPKCTKRKSLINLRRQLIVYNWYGYGRAWTSDKVLIAVYGFTEYRVDRKKTYYLFGKVNVSQEYNEPYIAL